MSDSIYHMTLNLLKNQIFGVKMAKFLPSVMQLYNGRHYVTHLSVNH